MCWAVALPEEVDTDMMDRPSRPLTIRPVVREDFPAIAHLLTQLYAAELPGALSGPRDGQQRLLRFTLEAKQGQGLQGRYVACSEAGDVLATAAVEHPNTPRYERAPAGTIRQSLAQIGYRATARLLVVVAQSMVGVPRPRTPDAVWLHSVVVDERHRGQGVGRALITALEQQAGEQGSRSAWLQVLAVNQPARRLYQRLGYADAWASPRWQAAITWPSYLMYKALTPGHEL